MTTTVANASPAWRQFTFFTSSPSFYSLPSSISSSIHSNSSYTFIADLDGNLVVLTNKSFEFVISWVPYHDGRCSFISTPPSPTTTILITCGDDSSTPYPLLRIWDLTPLTHTPPSPPTLLRQSPLTNSSKPPHPLSALAISPSLSHLAIGLADGTVLLVRHLDSLLESSLSSSATSKETVPSIGKLRVVNEGSDPVTGLGFSGSNSLFILTTSNVLNCLLTHSGNKNGPVNVLDDLGGAVGCSTMFGEGLFVVVRDEAIYSYGKEGREGCWAFEGPKSLILPFPSISPVYLLLLSPPLKTSSASQSPTIRNIARPLPLGESKQITKLTIFDLENKFIAGSVGFESAVKGVWESEDGGVWVAEDGGKLTKLVEQSLSISLSTLFVRNLYTLAVSLAKSRGLPKDELGEIYRRYGDHLYAKADYEGAMNCYLKTVGYVQASYVIRKFLDAQRLSHLTSYLQELHSRGLANSDHTTLLLNCYTKLADDDALKNFIHSSSTTTNKSLKDKEEGEGGGEEEPPFDLETALRVLRLAGYFIHASWLSEKYKQHSEYLRIQLEDLKDPSSALRYLRKNVDNKEIEVWIERWGKVLLGGDEDETTSFLIDLCCGGEEEDEDEVKEEKGEKEKGYLSYLSYNGGGHEDLSAMVGQSQLPSSPPPPPLPPPPSLIPGPRAINLLRAESLANNRKSGIYPQAPPPPPPPPPPLQEETEEEQTESKKKKKEKKKISPRPFFANFVDHEDCFVRFLESVGRRRWGKVIGEGEGAGVGGNGKAREVVEGGVDEEEEERAVWNTLLELYLARWSKEEEGSGEKERAGRKAMNLLNSKKKVGKGGIPYDDTRALLVCSSVGFTKGLVLLYEGLKMFDDIIRYWIDISESNSGGKSEEATRNVIDCLKKYGEERPYLFRLVLGFLTKSEERISGFQNDVVKILEEVDEKEILPPVKVVEILGKGGKAGIGVVREYLKRQLGREKAEIESDRALITSYRSESAKKQKEIQELSDPNTPRIFQVTRCSACGGQLDLPAVHFMCRHSYHQRCLAENEAQCPNCARSHGVIREIRRSNALMAGRHELFLDEVRESDDGFATVAAAFGKGLMSLTSKEDE